MALPLSITFILDLVAFISVYAVVTLGLNLQYGLTGIPNFGTSLGVAVGAYTVGALSGRIAQWTLHVLPQDDFLTQNSPIITAINDQLRQNPIPGFEIMAVVLAIAVLVGAGIGYLSALPAMKLRGDYLGISLLAFGEAALQIGDRVRPIINGALGVSVIDPFGFMGTLRFPAITIILVVAAVFVYLYVRRIETSPQGRALRAVRDNELTAETLGKDVQSIVKRTMTVGTAITALCGALFGFYTADVVARGYTRVDWVFWPWLMLAIGGGGNSKGVVVGVGSVIVIRSLINLYKFSFASFLPFDPGWLEYLLFGPALVIIMIYRPKGVVPEKPGSTTDKNRIGALYTKLGSQSRPGVVRSVALKIHNRIRRIYEELSVADGRGDQSTCVPTTSDGPS